MLERRIAVQADTHLSTQFTVDILEASFAFLDLLMVAGLTSRLGVQERTAAARCSIAEGQLELIGRLHA